MPAGRPTKYKADFHPEAFILKSRQGKCITEIAADWGTHRSRLHEWGVKHKEFRDAMKRGRAELEAYYARFGRKMAKGKVQGGNVTAWIWLTKNKLGWTDRVALVDDDVEGLEFFDDSSAVGGEGGTQK